jgi:MYXO-CTERM domain-containing protein
MSRPVGLLLALTIVVTAPGPSLAITRDEVLTRAKAFATHPWRCTTANLTASCKTSYKSVYTPGDYVGLPYDWGGYMTLFEFDQQIAQGLGAGSYSSDGELACTAGLDCSGYVSKCWDAAHYSTYNLDQISDVVAKVKAGDVFNKPNYHVILYSHDLANGSPVFFESAGYNVHVTVSGGWSYVSGYTQRSYKKITDGTVTPTGTLDQPIIIGAFPYSDSRDTKQAVSDVLDGCAAAPSKDESGPEMIYQATFTQPGTLTAAVSDDAATDVDIHLYSSANTSDCLARHDSAITVNVDCGTYLLVVDTFRNASGIEAPGAYTLTATFTPSGKACGGGPPAYAPKGKVGDACGFPGNPTLPFCNENLGGEVCVYTSTSSSGTSFCSKTCATNADCSELPGGCCKPITTGELYCYTAALCPKPDGGVLDTRPADSRASESGAAIDGSHGDGRPSTSDRSAPLADGVTAGDPPADEPSGCGCTVGASDRGRAPALGLVMLVLVLGIARRRIARRALERADQITGPSHATASESQATSEEGAYSSSVTDERHRL